MVWKGAVWAMDKHKFVISFTCEVVRGLGNAIEYRPGVDRVDLVEWSSVAGSESFDEGVLGEFANDEIFFEFNEEDYLVSECAVITKYSGPLDSDDVVGTVVWTSDLQKIPRSKYR